VARNRQRAKQRREARLAERGNSGATARPSDGANARARTEEEIEEQERIEREIDLEVGAPPPELGSSEDTLQHSPHLDDEVADLDEDDELEEEDYDFEDEEQPLDEAADREVAKGPRGVRGAKAHDRPGEPTHKGRGRLIAFLIAVWAELKRVQWPDRRQLTQMTGIVLVFVLIAGGYLGLLDAIFSKIIKAIL
jgi:preprotein translocase subunit SecE